MFIPPHTTPGDLYSLADGKIDSFIGNDDIPSLAEGRNDAGDGGEGLRVDDACLSAEMRGNIRFGLDVHVLGAVEARRRAWAHAVRSEDLDGTFLEMRVGTEGVEIVGCEIRHGAAIRELRLGSCRSKERGKNVSAIDGGICTRPAVTVAASDFERDT